MLLIIWFCAAVGLLFWSLAAWGVHHLLTLDPAWLQDAGRAAQQLPYGDWVERWIPGWQGLFAMALDLAQNAFTWLGAAAPWLVWTVWALGAAAVVAVALGASLLVALLRRKLPRPAVA